MSEENERERLRFPPASIALTGICIGIASASWLRSDADFLLPSILVCVVSLGLAFVFARLVFLKIVFLVCSLISIGFATYTFQQQQSSKAILPSIVDLHYSETIIFGKVISPVDSSETNYRYTIALDSLQVDSATLHNNEKLVLYVRKDKTFNHSLFPQQGDTIKAFVGLTQISESRNPYQRSSGNYLKDMTRATAVAIANSPFDLYYSKNRTPTKTPPLIPSILESIHTFVNNSLTNSISDSISRALAKAVVLGDRENLDSRTTMEFRNAGLSHILVVSGFNVAIVAALIYYLLRILGIVHLRPRIIMSMLIVALYCAVIGFEPSIFRAFAAIELIFLAILLERKPDIGNITAAVASTVLLFDPSQLFSISFQLSYGAVFSLVYVFPELAAHIIPTSIIVSKTFPAKILRYSAETLLCSLSIMIGLFPILIYHFHQITVISILSNIIGIPISSLITSISFLLIPLSFIHHSIASVYGDAVTFFSRVLIYTAEYSSDIKLLRFSIPPLNIFMLFLYALGAIYIIRSVNRKILLLRTTAVITVVILLLSLEIPLTSRILENNGELSILFFDVAQGDAALIRTPANKTYLIDFGGVSKRGKPIAEETILPILDAEGIRLIDAGFISHMHADHYVGLLPLLRSNTMRRIYTSGERTEGYFAYQLDSIVHTNHIPVSSLQQGDMIVLDSDVTMYIFNPDTVLRIPGERNTSASINHGSLAMKIVYRDNSFLFLGDIEASDEERLSKNYGTFLKSDVVKVAHHGSRYSSTRSITVASHPRFAILSVGDHNAFGHPTPEAISRWHNVGADVLRTDRDGAILIRSDGKTVRREFW